MMIQSVIKKPFDWVFAGRARVVSETEGPGTTGLPCKIEGDGQEGGRNRVRKLARTF